MGRPAAAARPTTPSGLDRQGHVVGLDPAASVVGFDASGLVLYSFAGVGIKLPRSSGAQYNAGRKVLPQQALPGDLIFYGPNGNQSVALFIGNGPDGGGRRSGRDGLAGSDQPTWRHTWSGSSPDDAGGRARSGRGRRPSARSTRWPWRFAPTTSRPRCRSTRPDVVSFDFEPPLQHVGADAKRRNWIGRLRGVPASARLSGARPHDRRRRRRGVHAQPQPDQRHAEERRPQPTRGFAPPPASARIDGIWLITHDQVSVPDRFRDRHRAARPHPLTARDAYVTMGDVSAFPGADPQLYRPRPPLANFVEYFGYWQRESGEPHRSRALPRGAATVIIDVSGRQRVDFYAADGRTRLDVPPAFIAGAGTASYITRIDAAQAVVTIHFRPAGALPFLGVPLGELENSCVGLDGLWGRHGSSTARTAGRNAIACGPDFACRVIPVAPLGVHDARTSPRGDGCTGRHRNTTRRCASRKHRR